MPERPGPVFNDDEQLRLQDAIDAQTGTAVLRAEGELDLVSAPVLERRLRELGGAHGAVVLDVRGLEFIDSSGIRALVVSHEAATRDGWSLSLTRSTPAVERALELVGLTRWFPRVPRGPEALQDDAQSSSP